MMLIVTRKEGQSVTIGYDIKVTFLGYKRGQVRIGFEAPEDVPIKRDEICKKPDDET
jgi:carbon storage regulator